MDFFEVIKTRNSCKRFSSKPIEREKLQRILEAGRLAPTAKNLQEQKIYVIEKEADLAKIDKLTPCRYGAPTCRYGAPTCLLVAFNKKNVYTYPNSTRDSGIEDATIVATHMMLQATNEGVESCWINRLTPEEVKTAFNLPEDEEVLMLLDLGYRHEEGTMNPLHEKRKPLDETVVFL